MALPKLDLKAIKKTQRALTSKAYDPMKQVEGYKKRLEASGIDPEKALDKRNLIEKALNLTPDQNTLFDIFEIINRPQQALFGAINASQTGQDVGKAALEGLKGNQEVYGAQLLQNAGIVENSGDKFGFDDIAGLALDIVADPIDLALIPATGGASAILKATKAVDSAKDAIKVAEGVGDVMGVIGKTVDLKMAQEALEAAKKIRMISPQGLAMRGLKRGIGGTFKLADKGVTKLMATMDDINIKALDKIGDTVTEKADFLKKYNDWKEWAGALMSRANSLPSNIFNKVFKVEGGVKLSTAKIGVKKAQFEKLFEETIDHISKADGMTPEMVDELRKTWGKDIMSYIEANYLNPSSNVLHAAQNIDQPLSDEMYSTLDELLAEQRLEINGRVITGADVYERTEVVSGKSGWLVKDRDLHEKLSTHLSDITTRGNYGIDNIQDDVEEVSRYVRKHLKDAGMGDADIQNIVDEIERTGSLTPDAIDTMRGTATPIDGIDNIIENTSELLRQIDFKFRVSGDQMLPRFFTDERLAHLTRMYENADFKTLVDTAYDYQRDMLRFMDEAAKDLVSSGTKFLKATPEGYLRHSATEQYKNLAEKLRRFPDFDFEVGFHGNYESFASRGFQMSAEEANDVMIAQINLLARNGNISKEAMEFWTDNQNLKMFRETIQESFDSYLKDAPKLAKQTLMIDEVLAKGWLQDKEIIRQFDPKGNVPPGYTKLESKKLKNELSKIAQYIDNPDYMQAALKLVPNSETVLIRTNVMDILGNLGDPSKQKPLLQLIDGMNNFFKRMKLMSPGFQMRNLIGNSFNIWASGVPIDQVVKNFSRADDIMRKGDDVLKKVTEGLALTAEDAEVWRWYEPFLKNGFHEVSRKLYDLEKIMMESKERSIIRKATDWNGKMNEAMDRRFRLALYMYAEQNPAIIQKLGLSDSSGLVRHVLFDPNDLTKFEKETAKRLVPFYTFTKKNLAYQWDNLFKNTKRYKDIRKTLNSMWRGIGVEKGEVEQYKLEDFWIPIPIINDKGQYTAIRARLPIEDLGEFLDNPLRKVVSSTSPAIRAPYEIVANRQMYSGQPIQEFRGQRGYMIPEASKKVEYLMGQFGLDTPVSTVMDIGRTAVQGFKGELQGKNAFDLIDKSFGRSMFGSGSIERASTIQAYQELDELRELFKYYKQEEIPIKTLTEIQNENKKLKQLLSRMQSVVR